MNNSLLAMNNTDWKILGIAHGLSWKLSQFPFFFTEECHSYLNALFRHAPDEVKIIYKNDATKSKIKYSCHCTLASKIQSKKNFFF